MSTKNFPSNGTSSKEDVLSLLSGGEGKKRSAAKKQQQEAPSKSTTSKEDVMDLLSGTVKKKPGESESSAGASPSPSTSPVEYDKVFNSYKNKTLSESEFNTLAQSDFGKQAGLNTIPKGSVPLFLQTHNGKTKKDYVNDIMQNVVDKYYPKSGDPGSDKARMEIMQGIFTGDANAINKIKGSITQNLQKKIDEINAQTQGTIYPGSPAYNTAQSSRGYNANQKAIVDGYTKQIKDVNDLMDDWQQIAITNSSDIRPFVEMDRNHPQLLTSIAATKIGEEIQKHQGLNNTSGNLEYERARIGLANIIRNETMQYNELAQAALLGKNQEAQKAATEKLAQIKRYQDWYSRLDIEQFPDVGTSNTARFIGDQIAKEHPGKWIISKGDVDEAAFALEKENPGWLVQYGKFLDVLKDHTGNIPHPGFAGGFLRGAAKGGEDIKKAWDVFSWITTYGAHAMGDDELDRSPAMKGTSFSGAFPTKIVYDKEGKAYREDNNEHYGKIDWNNAYRVMGESLPGLLEWVGAEETGVGAAKILGAGKNVSRGTGLITASYLTSYDENRKLADQLIPEDTSMGDAKKALLANFMTVSTAAVFKAMDYSPAKFVENNISKAASQDALKILEGNNWERIPEKKMAAFMKDQILPRAKAMAGALGKNLSGGAKIGAATVIDQRIKDAAAYIANSENSNPSTVEDNIKQFASQALIMNAAGLLGLASAGVSDHMRDALYAAGTRAPQYIEHINEMVERGEMDQKQADRTISLLHTVSEEVGRVQMEQTDKGLPLTIGQKKKIVAARFRQRAAELLKDNGEAGVDHVENETKSEIKEVKKSDKLQAIEDSPAFKSIKDAEGGAPKSFNEIDPDKDYTYTKNGVEVTESGAKLLDHLLNGDIYEEANKPAAAPEGTAAKSEEAKAEDQNVGQAEEAKAVLAKVKDKLGVYADLSETDPLAVLKDIADQMTGTHRDGTKSELPNAEKAVRDQYGDEVADLAKKLYGAPTVEAAVIEVGGKVFEGKNHAEAIEKAKEAGEDISGIDRQRDGKFRLSDGTIIDRDEAMKRFGADHSEQLIEQDEKAKQADLDFEQKNKTNEKGENERQAEEVKGNEGNIGAPKEKKISERFQGIDPAEITDPYDKVLHYFGAGGKIHAKALQEIFGDKRGKSVESERRLRISLAGKDAPTIDQLAHQMWEADTTGKHTTEDYKDAIEKALLDYNSSSAMAKSIVERYDIDAAREKYEAEHGPEFAAIYDNLTEDEINHILELDASENATKLLDDYFDNLSKQKQEANEKGKNTKQEGGEGSETSPNEGEQQAGGQKAGKEGVLNDRTQKGGRGSRAEAAPSLKIGDKVELGGKLWNVEEVGDTKVKVSDPVTNTVTSIPIEQAQKGLKTDEAQNKRLEAAKTLRDSAERLRADGDEEGATALEARAAELEQPAEIPPQKTSIANKIIDSERMARGFDPIDKAIRRAWANEVLVEAKAKIDSGEANPVYFARELIKNPRPLTDTEDAILTIGRMQLWNDHQNTMKVLESALGKKDDAATSAARFKLNYLEDAIYENDLAARKVGTANARGLAARRMMIASDYSLVSQKTRMRIANLGKELDPELNEKLEKMSKDLEAANEKLRQYEEAFKDRQAQAEINKTRAASGPKKPKKSHDEYVADRKSIVNDIRDKLKKARSETQATVVPYAKELIEIAPDVARLVKSLVDEGIDRLEDLVKELHPMLKQEIPDITKEDVRDMIGGEYNQGRKPLTENQTLLRDLKEEAALATKYEKMLKGEYTPEKQQELERTPEVMELRKKISDFKKEQATEARIAKKEAELQRLRDRREKAPGKSKEKQEVSPEEKELDDQIRMERAAWAKEKRESNAYRLEQYKKRLQRKIDELQNAINKGDFKKTPKRPLELDQEAIDLRAAVARIQKRFDAERVKLEKKNRAGWEKTVDFFTKWHRLALLSGLTTLGKLTMAAQERMFITPFEEAVGGGLSLLPGISKVAAMAPREGGFDLTAEGKAAKNYIDKATLHDMIAKIREGRSPMDLIYSKKLELPPEAIGFFGNLHSALKVLPQRGEFSRSFEKRYNFYKKQGLAVDDPLIQMKIGAEAYNDSLRAIFMQDNALSDAYKVALNYLESKGDAGKAVTYVLKNLLPIVKVPTNIAGEATSYAIGGAKAAFAARKQLFGAIKMMAGIKNGIETMTPDQADYIMRNLKKQFIGAGFFALGYFGAANVGGYYTGKRPEDDVEVGGLRMFGVDIPRWMVHNPALEMLQLGATVRRVKDKYAEDTEVNGYWAGAVEGSKGIAEQVPFFNFGQQADKAFQSSKSLDKFADEFIKNATIPIMLQEFAKWQDTDENGNPIKRYPTDLGETLATGLPYLRENVSDTKPKKNQATGAGAGGTYQP